MTILEYQRRLSALSASLEDLAGEAMQDCGDEFIKQQQAQMYAGKTVYESNIVPQYTYQYFLYKVRKKGQSGVVTLLNDGDFYKGMKFSIPSRGTYEITSTDSKTDKLEDKYKAIWGLGGPFRSVYLNNLRPAFILRILNKLNGR